jgi:hypothetical protein
VIQRKRNEWNKLHQTATSSIILHPVTICFREPSISQQVVVTLVGECAFTFAGRRVTAASRNVELRAEKKYRVLVPW